MTGEATIISYDDLYQVTKTIFEKNGLPPDDAAFVAECLLYADLRGVPSHGVNRVSNYTQRLKSKRTH
jgi:LDH2 family malate/lactate/ureidoglycolate dehydrogenase